jgi:hypothetical protein
MSKQRANSNRLACGLGPRAPFPVTTPGTPVRARLLRKGDLDARQLLRILTNTMHGSRFCAGNRAVTYPMLACIGSLAIPQISKTRARLR